MLKTSALAVLSVVLATAGQLFLKAGMDKIGYIGTSKISKPLALVMSVARTPQVIVGLAFFAVSASVWLLVLSRAPLSFAYPFAGLTYLFIVMFARFVLKEPVPGARWVGVVLIVIGIVVVGATAPPDPGERGSVSR